MLIPSAIARETRLLVAAGIYLTVVLSSAGCMKGCPEAPYEPVGPEVEAAAECAPGTCPVECSADETCAERGIFCESCADFMAYAAEECHNCSLGAAGYGGEAGAVLQLTCIDGSF
jgi:hypothetical protein